MADFVNVTVNPTYFKAYIQLGIICKIEGRKQEAKELFKKAIACDLENDVATFQLGLLHMDERN